MVQLPTSLWEAQHCQAASFRRSFISGTYSPSSFFVVLFSFNLFLTCLVCIQTSTSLSMPSFLKLRTRKTFPPISEPSCHLNSWHEAGSKCGKASPTWEQPKSCCHHHPSQSTGALKSILHLGCGGGAEHPLPSIWCNSNSFWNEPPRLVSVQRPARSLMLLFILVIWGRS